MTRKSLGGRQVGRRTVLKTTGLALAGGLLASGSASAHGDGVPGDSGDVITVGDGQAHAYTEQATGMLSAIGVRFDASALENLPETPADWPPEGVPEGTPFSVENTLSLPNGNTGRFEYATMDWNPGGHEPEGLYTHPHFDFHFYMLKEDEVAAIPPGVASYEVPPDLMPAQTQYASDVDPNAVRGVVPGMGEHLVSMPASVPATPGEDGWSVYIWGAYDPDGDGVGQLTFMEPMITVAFLEALRGDGSADASATPIQIPMPSRFLKGGAYPTEMDVRYHAHDDTFTVSLESFALYRGYGRRGWMA